MDVTYRGRAVSLADTLVIADLHLGKAAASSVEFPLGAIEDVVERVEGLLARFEPDEFVVAGDALHSFGRVPEAVEEAIADLARAAREAGARPVFVVGNHDTMLDSVWNGPTEDEYVIEGDGTDDGDSAGDGGGSITVICHGHEEPEAEADRYIVGHDHPAIVIEGQKRQCFLSGRSAYRGADVLVLPTFNRLVEGVSVNGRIGETRPELSPLVTDVGLFRPIVYDEEAEETLEFPPLRQFSRML